MADKSGGTFRRGIVTNNPLLFQIIGVCPVVAIALSVRTAIVVAMINALELLIIETLACLLFKKLKRYIRVLIYAILGFLINMPLFVLLGRFEPEMSESIGIFLPLLAVNSVIAVKCETYAVKNTLKNTFADAVATALGYGIVTVLVGSLREVLGSGTFYGKSIGLPYTAEAFLMPFGGFLLLGFIAAAVKGLNSKKHADEINSAMLDTSQIRMLHIKHLKQLIDESDDDDIFFDETVVADIGEKKKLFRRSPKPTVTEQTIEVPPIDLTGEDTASQAQTEEKPVGYQPFADLLKTLENHEPQTVEVAEPEPDPLELNEEWEVSDESLTQPEDDGQPDGDDGGKEK